MDLPSSSYYYEDDFEVYVAVKSRSLKKLSNKKKSSKRRNKVTPIKVKHDYSLRGGSQQ